MYSSRRPRARSTLSLVAVATVDANGALRARRCRSATAPFELAKQDDGEWRITEAPDGIVLDRDVFPTRVPRLLADVLRPDVAVPRPRRALVPDGERRARASPTRSSTSRRATGSRIGRNGVPARASRSSPSVPVESGVAEVDLSDCRARRAGRHSGPDATPSSRRAWRRPGVTDVAAVRRRRRPSRPSRSRCARPGDRALAGAHRRRASGFLVGRRARAGPGTDRRDRGPCRRPRSRSTAERDFAALRLDRRHGRAPGRRRHVRPARRPRRGSSIPRSTRSTSCGACRDDSRPRSPRSSPDGTAGRRSPTRGRAPPQSPRWRCRGTARGWPRS